MKNIIIESLKDTEKSISSLSRELKNNGFDIHRLMITGYLRALRDTGYLKEKDIPPSKVYSISPTHKRDIYSTIGEKTCLLEDDPKKQINIALYALQKIFRRPISSEELRRCGFSGNIDAAVVNEDDSKDIKRLLIKAGFKLQKNDRMYKTSEKWNEEYQAIITEMLIENFEIGQFVLGAKQTKLGVL
jgi:DNA-binding transcriptional ArsR family regulator